jgi:hypothetical protein
VSAYKLLLVPEEHIVAYRSEDSSQALLSLFGESYEVVADVGEDRIIRMSRLVYDAIEVAET